MKLLLFILLIISTSVYAFEPTNLTGSKEEVRELFSKTWGKFKNFDNNHCYRRAHVISHQLKSEFDINTMKVFFFNGDKYEMAMGWWYHVAPMIYYKGEGVVLDKGLFEGASYLSDWIAAFGEGHKCRELKSMDNFKEIKKNEYCMYIIVPMYYYSPRDLKEMNMSSFARDDVGDMTFSLPRRQRGKYKRAYPLD